MGAPPPLTSPEQALSVPADGPLVIADASPLIGLARIGHFGLLPALFGTVTVTRAVADEVLNGGQFPETPLLEKAFAQPWLQVAEQTQTAREADPSTSDAQVADLRSLYLIDEGEASSLCLALQLGSQGQHVLLLIDDHRGREAARRLALPMLGTAGLLLLARRQGLIEAVKPLVNGLRAAGYHLSDRLVEAVLRQAGE